MTWWLIEGEVDCSDFRFSTSISKRIESDTEPTESDAAWALRHGWDGRVPALTDAREA